MGRESGKELSGELRDVADGHLQEVRRGTVVVACLLRLREPEYGYALLESLNRAGIHVEANTLYPLLRRLEKQGLLISEWRTAEPRPRKYYRTNADGERVAGELIAEWRRLNSALTGLIDPRVTTVGAEEKAEQ